MPSNVKEEGFETLIVKYLTEVNGYEEGKNSDYNQDYAVDETRLFRFLEATQPEKLEKLAEKLTNLKEIFNEHVGALTMPNGMTIEEYIKANEDQLAQDSSDYSSIIDDSEDSSHPGTPKQKKKTN